MRKKSTRCCVAEFEIVPVRLRWPREKFHDNNKWNRLIFRTKQRREISSFDFNWFRQWIVISICTSRNRVAIRHIVLKIICELCNFSVCRIINGLSRFNWCPSGHFNAQRLDAYDWKNMGLELFVARVHNIPVRCGYCAVYSSVFSMFAKLHAERAHTQSRCYSHSHHALRLRLFDHTTIQDSHHSHEPRTCTRRHTHTLIHGRFRFQPQ